MLTSFNGKKYKKRSFSRGGKKRSSILIVWALVFKLLMKHSEGDISEIRRGPKIETFKKKKKKPIF